MITMYRTLVRGTLRQCSALCVGGSPSQPGGADIQVARVERDGKIQLVIPGAGLAGAFIETAGRVFPDLFRLDPDIKPEKGKKEEKKKHPRGRRITAKSREGSPDEILQSVWRFSPSYGTKDTVELRQGVGIRQATGAAAVERNALYDYETIPPDHTWEFFLEIDILRGGIDAEIVGFYALLEWFEGRCWLGAAAARGMGWMQLERVDILRLPASEAAIAGWPNNTKSLEQWWQDHQNLASETISGKKDALCQWVKKQELKPAEDRFHYVILEGTIQAGQEAGVYGLEAFSVGGHAAGFLQPLSDPILRPLGVSREAWQKSYDSDAPVLASEIGGAKEPLVPGSGLRGPLRHAASRWQRGTGAATIVDPNAGEIVEKSEDCVSVLFGLTGHSGRLLVCDAHLEGKPKEGKPFLLALWQHHGEDEFAGGVYGSGKFDRTVVVGGGFGLRLVIEAANLDDLRKSVETIQPALRLAELGFVPIGGAKQRGAGGGVWRFTKARYTRAGDEGEPVREEKSGDEAKPQPVPEEVSVIKLLLDAMPTPAKGEIS